MADFDLDNPDIEPAQFYYNQAVALPIPIDPNALIPTGSTTIVTTINGGGGGQATGPTVTITSAWNGVNFTASQGTITLDIVNAANARSDLGAAASGINTDISQLNGASQVDVSSHYEVAGTQVVQAQGAAVADASGGATIDAEARTAINTLLARLRVHGLIAP